MNHYPGAQRSCDPYLIVADRIIQERFREADQYRLTHPPRDPCTSLVLRHIRVWPQAARRSLVAHPLWKSGAGRTG